MSSLRLPRRTAHAGKRGMLNNGDLSGLLSIAHREKRCRRMIFASLPTWLGHRFSINFTGIDTHIAIGRRSWRAGSKRQRPTASTAAWSRSVCPADRST
jgi:hypothetical protein